MHGSCQYCHYNNITSQMAEIHARRKGPLLGVNSVWPPRNAERCYYLQFYSTLCKNNQTSFFLWLTVSTATSNRVKSLGSDQMIHSASRGGRCLIKCVLDSKDCGGSLSVTHLGRPVLSRTAAPPRQPQPHYFTFTIIKHPRMPSLAWMPCGCY